MKEIDSGSDVDTGLVTRQELNSTGDIIQLTNCWIIDSGATCHICHERVYVLYYLSFNQLPHVQVEVNMVKKSNEIVWHERFGHLGKRNLQRLLKESLINGIDYHVFVRRASMKKFIEGVSLLLAENEENIH